MTDWRAQNSPTTPPEFWQLLADEYEAGGKRISAQFDAHADNALTVRALYLAGRATEREWKDAKDEVEVAFYREIKTWRARRRDKRNLELWEVLAEEFEQAGERARLLDEPFKDVADKAIAAKAAYDASPLEHEGQLWLAAKTAVEQRLFVLIDEAPPRTALCLSGGGVRSGTISLGIIQGLAEFAGTPLSSFDFLSTVSGGGYAGGWFSAWAARDGGPAAVSQALKKPPESTLEPEPEPLLHIRQYSAFLSPKLGALSADTWTLASTILRNMILNWTILIPVIMAALLIPNFYWSLFDTTTFGGVWWLPWFTLAVGIAAGSWGAAYILWHLPAFCGPSRAGDDSFIGWALVPLTLSAAALSLHWGLRMAATGAQASGNYTLAQMATIGAGIHLAGALAATAILLGRSRPAGRKSAEQPKLDLISFGIAWVAAAASGACAGSITYLVSTYFQSHFVRLLPIYVCIAVPVILSSFTIAALIMVGLASEVTGDDDREWWARAGAWLLIVITCWLIFSASVVYGPALLFWTVAKVVTFVGTLTLGGIASKLGFSGKTSAGRREDAKDTPAAKSSGWRDIVAGLAGPAFLLLLVAILALANQAAVEHLPGWLPLVKIKTAAILYLLTGGVAAAVLCSRLINVNRFSIHSMYRLRLVRTYIGASHKNRERSVSRFIDMNDGDNIPMAHLSSQRPLHLVNMTLNLVGGTNLAWQQRKAESFTSSRLRTGSLRVGYQPTESYGGKQRGTQRGLSLGGAVAISGAAASPNMGYHSSPLLSFVMTLFNARLGWWLANPGLAGEGSWDTDGPTISFAPIFNEALGRTNDTSRWVYLSDGGHFENLGIYEMVLRRCKTIVVVDGGQDGGYTYEDLGNACRKARVDLGIAIEFRDVKIFGKHDPRNRYCAVGVIRYKEDETQNGTILYMKACINGTEPIDVLNYASMNTAFPQQGTEELWFNESQFESYRKLGQHMVSQIKNKAEAVDLGIDGFVTAARKYIAS